MDAAIAAAIDELVETLSHRLDDPEWDAATARAWRTHLVGLRRRLERGEAPAGDQHHLMQWLAFDGIGAGAVAARFRQLEARLRELYDDDVDAHRLVRA